MQENEVLINIQNMLHNNEFSSTVDRQVSEEQEKQKAL